MSIRTICFCIVLAASGIFISGFANAQAQRPYYLHALSDLSAARTMLLQHIGGKPMTHNEKEALREINEIIKEVNQAPIDIGQPKAPTGQNAAVPLRQCIEFLKKAKNDFSQEQDSHFADGLRDRSMKSCDEAIKFVTQETADTKMQVK